jgi:hypothetical protein
VISSPAKRVHYPESDGERVADNTLHLRELGVDPDSIT